ncbi:MAG: DUF1345 domain-containing protein [Brevundimonas sp.]|uniref:DUF1345 domain-containing protein n=1 Tax=Brevundimonas sp. TaxID=1871086 RepID=UPI00248996DE|nr:DUF1345 domain-containing protein [Brevundimonas sp.]MDI1325712.1 DUF1345 domain-containing protein [Brevundimonas sp.]
MNASGWLRLHWPLILLLLIALSSLAWPIGGGWLSRLALGWDVGVGLFLVESAFKLTRARSADDIRKRAAALDEAGGAVLPLALFAAVASIAVVVGEAVQVAHDKDQAGGAAVLALVTVALSWTFVHAIFAFHYAHDFYAPAPAGGSRAKGRTRDRGGLIFPGGEDPDYWDFVHFSLIIGVAQQTADIQISDKALRRTATVHSVTAFLFNTVIVALTVNLAISLLGGG